MIDSKTLGRRIKYFRKRAGLSQMDLELEIGASAGMISRIESGKVNPSKETVFSIIDSLKMKPIEISYVMGLFHGEVNEKEIEKARKKFSSVLNSPKKLAYLLDNRSRIVVLSEGFKNLAKNMGFDGSVFLGKNVVEILFDPKIGRAAFSKEKFDETALPVLAVLNQERPFLLGEPWWDDLINRVKELPDFERLWKKVQEMEFDLFSEDARTIYFDLGEGAIPMVFTIITLFEDPRFTILEYKPK